MKQNKMWLVVTICLIFFILILIGIIIGNKNNNSNSFEKKTYCHSLYDKVYDDYEKKFWKRDNTIRQYLSDFDLFYSETSDSCIIAYTIYKTYYDDDLKKKVDEDIYVIKDYLNENSTILYCVNNDKNLYDYSGLTCSINYKEKLDELRK